MFIILLIIAIASLPIYFTGNTIARWEGFVFLLYYIAYTLYLVLNASGSTDLATLTTAILYGLAPITALALVLTMVREVQMRRQVA
jgi:cation:H+ antiporter